VSSHADVLRELGIRLDRVNLYPALIGQQHTPTGFA
jgi:hypothetical protein